MMASTSLLKMDSEKKQQKRIGHPRELGKSPFVPIVRHARNTNLIVQCEEWLKWRLVYSRHTTVSNAGEQVFILMWLWPGWSRTGGVCTWLDMQWSCVLNLSKMKKWHHLTPNYPQCEGCKDLPSVHKYGKWLNVVCVVFCAWSVYAVLATYMYCLRSCFYLIN